MATWSRIARTALSYASNSAFKQTSMEEQFGKLASQQFRSQWRGFASGGHHGEGITHAGLTLHKPASWHVATGKALAGLMWFWILYRFYHDYDTFLFGHAQHHEHELHDEKHEEEETL